MKRIALIVAACLLWTVPAVAEDLVAPSSDPSTAAPEPRAFPGANGRIAFGRLSNEHYLIFSITARGAGPILLTDRSMDSFTPAWSPDGTKIAYRRRGTGKQGIWTARADGKNAGRIPNTNWACGYPSWSPDGKEVAYSNEEDDQVWRINVDGTGKTQVTKGRLNSAPAWSPDGTLIAFMSKRDGDQEIFVTNADGSGSAVQLTNNSVDDSYPDWSPDGTKIAFQRKRNNDWEIFRMSADGTSIKRLTNHLGSDLSPAWSPNGKRIVYAAWDGNDYEIYTMTKGGTKRRQVTSNVLNDYFPDWEPA